MRPAAVEAMVLDGWSPVGLFGHLFLHASPLHLIGNMLFLWVFGNAVCPKVGNGPYLLIYFGMGVVSAVMHLAVSDEGAVGASGAINGIVGMYLVMYPLNDVKTLVGTFYYVRLLSVSAVFVILFFVMFDIVGILLGTERVAYWSHLAGIAAGVGLAGFLLVSGWIRMTEHGNYMGEVVYARRPSVIDDTTRATMRPKEPGGGNPRNVRAPR